MANHIRLSASTGQLQVDLDGTGTAFGYVTVATLTNVLGPTTVRYDLSNGTTATVVVSPSAPPVALDLNRDGVVSFLAADAGVTFDYGGGKVATAWVAPVDGLLARDADNDGTITGNEIVFATTGSDLEGVRTVYDSNADGRLDAGDGAFSQFGVWQDNDSDGVTDAGEFSSLSERGITSIDLQSDGVAYTAAGGDVTVHGETTFTWTDGTQGTVADASFATSQLDRMAHRTAEIVASSVIAGAVLGLATAAAAATNDNPAVSSAEREADSSEPSATAATADRGLEYGVSVELLSEEPDTEQGSAPDARLSTGEVARDVDIGDLIEHYSASPASASDSGSSALYSPVAHGGFSDIHVSPDMAALAMASGQASPAENGEAQLAAVTEALSDAQDSEFVDSLVANLAGNEHTSAATAPDTAGLMAILSAGIQSDPVFLQSTFQSDPMDQQALAAAHA